MTIEKQLADALRIIAAHEVAGPLTQNDDNVSLSDLPFYVAGKAHAELAVLHNIARNALDAYEARPVATDEQVERDRAVGHLLDVWEQYPRDEHGSLMDPLRNALNSLMRVCEGLAALQPQVSPELIDKLGKLATYLTEQGEYEACDLIDTVVERVTKPALQPQDGWKDIATAPRDGTWFQAYRPASKVGKRQRVVTMCWLASEKDFAWPVDIFDEYSPPDLDKKDARGLHVDIYTGSSTFTHWRPLPAPPAAEIERTKG